MRHTDEEIEHAAQRFDQLADALDPAQAQVETAATSVRLRPPLTPYARTRHDKKTPMTPLVPVAAPGTR